MTIVTTAASLRNRAKALKAVRHFFDLNNVYEVDPPLLSRFPSIDAHIDPIETVSPKGYLHTSPEYRMKEALAETGLDLYYLGHVFRKEEQGALHSQEFTMVEWYRRDCTLKQFIQENINLLAIFLGKLPVTYSSYDAACYRYLNTTYACCQDSCEQVKQYGASLSTKEEAWDLLFSESVQPHLGKNGIEILFDFPVDMAALSQVLNGKAQRFEVFYQGVELGNGYLELWDPHLQKERMDQENAKRLNMQKPELPIDHGIISALHIPRNYCGVALGFDRLMMLQESHTHINKVMFPNTPQPLETF